MKSKRNIYDKKDSLELGEQAERLFAQIAIEKGWKIVVASNRSNIDEHWDFLIEKEQEKYRVDVKAMKRLSRKDINVQDKWVWIELHGVRKYDRGWLYGGKADLIAFEKKNSFLIVKRTDLMEMIPKLVDKHKTVFYARDAKYKIYSRPNRPDKLTLIEIEKLNSIKWEEWRK